MGGGVWGEGGMMSGKGAGRSRMTFGVCMRLVLKEMQLSGLGVCVGGVWKTHEQRRGSPDARLCSYVCFRKDTNTNSYTPVVGSNRVKELRTVSLYGNEILQRGG